MRSAFFITLCAVIFVGSISAADRAPAEWPHYNGPDLNLPIIKADWLTSFNSSEAWTAQVGTGFSSLAVADGKIFTMGNVDNTDSVIALDLASGKELWRHSYPCKLNPRLYKGGPNATPTYLSGQVFTLSREGHCFCLDANTGKVLWQRHLVKDAKYQLPGFGFSGSPLVADGIVYLNVGTHGVALDAKTGQTKWSSGTEKAGYASPILYGDKHILMFDGKHLSAVEKANGTVTWQFPWPTKYGINSPQPVVVGDKIFITTGYGMGCALIDLSSGKPQQVYKNKVYECQMSGPVILGDYLYGVSAYRSKPGELRCVELSTGKQVWAKGGFGHGALIAIGKTLVVQAEKGDVVMVDANPEAYKEIGRKKLLNEVCWTQPVVVAGKLLVRNSAGRVVCHDLK